MSESEILAAAQSRIAELESSLAAVLERAVRAEHKNRDLRAILAQHGLATADEATEPEDGVSNEA